MNPVFASLPVTVFTRMSALAQARGAINLGQGFPDARGPEDMLAAAAEALLTGDNQYPPTRGTEALRRAIAAHYAHHQGLEIDWPGETIVTSGATEALAATILGLVSPGDEVIVFQPAYDAYVPLIRQAGGAPRFIGLAPPDWRITREALDAVASPRTRAIVLNSPLNPSASMVSDEELAMLAEFCVARDLIAICDEVWEHVVFDGRVHRSLMTLPGMRERAVKIGSAGKIFSLTGWKVGWAIAAPRLADPIAKAHQFLTFTTAPNLQAAVAHGLAKDDGYFTDMRAGYERSRDRLASALTDAGYAVLPCAGTYFLLIDLPASGIGLDDESFCQRIVAEFGVAAIPVSALYDERPVTSTVRLCFAKRDDTLDAAAERLGRARAALVHR
ncbi:MAG: aminotransferase [Sphingomonadaceae bacterium]|nr:aminotransferase [Sphingomonadaceae bacterium]